jgi:hypothetical protein
MERQNKKRPQTRLAIAIPLVCAGKIVPSAGGPTAGGEVETAETSVPHTLQNLSPTGTLFPQAEQNTLASPENWDNTVRREAIGVNLEIRLDLDEADGTLSAVGSTYSDDSEAVYDGVSRPGVRIVSFAPMLKHNLFPLPTILETLVKAGKALWAFR